MIFKPNHLTFVIFLPSPRHSSPYFINVCGVDIFIEPAKRLMYSIFSIYFIGFLLLKNRSENKILCCIKKAASSIKRKNELTAGIGPRINAHKTGYMCFNQTGNISTLNGIPLKLVDKFTYLGSNVSSTETDINTRLAKALSAIDRLSVIWKSDLTDKMKRSFFQAAVVSIVLYGCTTWTLTKRMEKKLDGNYTRMLRVILNKSWRQHPTNQQLYGHLPPITKTLKFRRPRHAEHCWRSRDELISDVLLWAPSYGRAKAGWPARTSIQQLWVDTGCSPEDLPEAMDDREGCRERVRDIRADGTRWWWWWWIYIIFSRNSSWLCLSESCAIPQSTKPDHKKANYFYET